MSDSPPHLAEQPLFIHESWHRCAAMMHRETWRAPHQAQGVTFTSIRRRKTALITIAQAALEDAWEFMESRPCALLILDEVMTGFRVGLGGALVALTFRLNRKYGAYGLMKLLAARRHPRRTA